MALILRMAPDVCPARVEGSETSEVVIRVSVVGLMCSEARCAPGVGEAIASGVPSKIIL